MPRAAEAARVPRLAQERGLHPPRNAHRRDDGGDGRDHRLWLAAWVQEGVRPHAAAAAAGADDALGPRRVRLPRAASLRRREHQEELHRRVPGNIYIINVSKSVLGDFNLEAPHSVTYVRV